ncbi:unnamed protein product, partial [Closterium sp. Naga37s-1]
GRGKDGVGKRGGGSDRGDDFVRAQPSLDARLPEDPGVGGGEGAAAAEAGGNTTDADAKGMMGRLYDVMLQLTEDVNNLLDEDEEQLSTTDKVQIRRIIKNRWDNNLACAMHVAGRILNPANQEEDIFGSDAECTRVFKAFINQHVEFLIGHDGKGREEDVDYLLALGDGLRAFLDLKGSFGMPEALAQRAEVKAGKYFPFASSLNFVTASPLLVRPPPVAPQLPVGPPPVAPQLLVGPPPVALQLLVGPPPVAPQLLVGPPPVALQLLVGPPPVAPQLFVGPPPVAPHLHFYPHSPFPAAKQVQQRSRAAVQQRIRAAE